MGVEFMVKNHVINLNEALMDDQARGSAAEVLADMNVTGHSLTKAATDAKKQIATREGWTCTVLQPAELRQFAGGLLRGVDDFAMRRQVAENPEYLTLYHQLITEVSALGDENSVDQVSSHLKQLRTLVEQLSLSQNVTATQLRRVAADILAAFEPAKSDSLIAAQYNALRAGYTTPRILTIDEWRRLIKQFHDVLPQFKQELRGYLFDVLAELHDQVVHYDAESLPEVVEFFQEIDMMIHTAARPSDFIGVMARFDDVEGVIATMITQDASLERIREFTHNILESLDAAMSAGIALTSSGQETLAICKNDFEQEDLDRAQYCNLVKRLQSIRLS